MHEKRSKGRCVGEFDPRSMITATAAPRPLSFQPYIMYLRNPRFAESNLENHNCNIARTAYNGYSLGELNARDMGSAYTNTDTNGQ